jgi:hypothetical protein
LKAKFVVILLSVALIYVVILIAGIRGDASAKQRQNEMEAMFALVQPYPGAALVQHSSSHKISNGIVSSSYATPASFPDIRTYYDAELSKHGWSFVSEEHLLEWGKDLGHRAVYYRRAPYRASLDSGGKGFGLSFTW